MKKLQELVRIVTRKKFLSESILDLDNPENQHFLPYRLYSGVKNGEFAEDSDAAQSIYNSPEISDKYRRLKWQTKDLLYNKLLLINIDRDDSSEYFVALVDINRKLFVAKMLFYLGAKKSAEQLSRYLLEKAAKYSVPSVVLECARELREFYHYRGEKKNFEEMQQICARYRDIVNAEDTVKELWQSIGVVYAKTNSIQEDLLDDHLEKFRQIEKIRETYSSYAIELNYFRAKNLIYQVQGDYKALVQSCNDAVSYLRSNTHLLEDQRQLEFFSVKLSAYMSLREYTNAKFTAQLCVRYSQEGTSNWFLFQFRMFHVCMVTEDYASAGATLYAMRNNDMLDSQPEHIKERLLLFEGYYTYALNEAEYHGSETKEFDVEALKQNTPTLQKDKAGWNSAIVILQLLYHMKRGEVDQIYDRFESLRSYCHKYLYKNSTYRSQVFIRMLLILSKESLNYRRVERLGRQWFAKLEKHSNLVDESEILPYERLWNWVLETLKSDKKLVADFRAEIIRRQAV